MLLCTRWAVESSLVGHTLENGTKMLWNALVNTLNIMLYWEVYVAAAIYLIMSFGPVLLFSSLGRGAGSTLTFIAQPFFHALGILAFTTLVMPIVLGLSEDAYWHLPWKFVTDAPWEVAKNALLLIGISIMIGFIPLLGSLPSFSSLALGLFATKMVFDLAGVEGISRADLLPNLGVGIGILVLGAAISIIGTIMVSMISSLVASTLTKDVEEVSSLLAFPITAALGFAPLLVYLSWLGVTLN